MVKKLTTERRKHLRAKRVLSIQYRINKSKTKKPDKAWSLSTTEDMSLGGLSFYTDRELRVGDILETKVVMSGILDIFSGYAKVVRVERKREAAHFLIGVKFVNKTSKFRSAKQHSPRTKKRSSKKRTSR